MRPLTTRILRAADPCGFSPFTVAANNTRCDRVHRRDAIDEDPLTDQEHRQLRDLLELAGRITGAVIQPGDTSSGGPLFDSVDRDPSKRCSVRPSSAR
jgi:hypothetical protein